MTSALFRAETVKSVGEELAAAAGHRMTRLAAALEPADTTLSVEGTHGWPEEGTVFVEGLDFPEIAYTGKTATSLTGLTRDAHETRTAEFGFVAIDGTAYSALAQARTELFVRLAAGTALDRLARSYAIERPGPWMDDDSFRELVRTVIYLDNGTWWAVWRVCNAFSRPFRVTGETNVNGQTITDGSAPFGSQMIGRYVEVTDTDGTVRTHRIVGATSTTLTLADWNGAYWQAADYSSDTREWSVLAFLVHVDPDVGGTMPCEVLVQLFANELLPPVHFVPKFTEDDYAAVTPPDMTDVGPPAVDLESDSSKDGHASGIVLEDEDIASGSVSPGLPFTIGGGGVVALDTLLSDIVVLGVKVRSEVWPV